MKLFSPGVAAKASEVEAGGDGKDEEDEPSLPLGEVEGIYNDNDGDEDY